MLIGLNRPEKRNAFSSTMINELTDAYEEMEENDQVRCAILFAHGAHFTSGLDLGEIAPKILQELLLFKKKRLILGESIPTKNGQNPLLLLFMVNN